MGKNRVYNSIREYYRQRPSIASESTQKKLTGVEETVGLRVICWVESLLERDDKGR